MNRDTVIIDATNRPLGRLASEVAVILRGKNKPDFQPHIDSGSIVIIKNIGNIKFTGKKAKQKIYYHHTGYLGNMKKITLEKLFIKKPNEVLRKAVYGMLAKNKLRPNQMKRLKFE